MDLRSAGGIVPTDYPTLPCACLHLTMTLLSTNFLCDMCGFPFTLT